MSSICSRCKHFKYSSVKEFSHYLLCFERILLKKWIRNDIRAQTIGDCKYTLEHGGFPCPLANGYERPFLGIYTNKCRDGITSCEHFHLNEDQECQD